MPTALVLSPHLDDAAFSCGGLMALLADAGWRTCMVTAFTRSVGEPTGFALACQLDKGLAADVDYMALRRTEDEEAASLLGVQDLRWLDLPEAPHRGYHSAPALFGAMREDDEVWRPLSALIAGLMAELDPALVLAPQGLGNHVDHRQTIMALRDAAPGAPAAFYRDTPYVIRDAAAVPSPLLPPLAAWQLPIAAALERKVSASCAYRSQVGFQFGGTDGVGTALRSLALREGGGEATERFVGRFPDLPSA